MKSRAAPNDTEPTMNFPYQQRAAGTSLTHVTVLNKGLMDVTSRFFPLDQFLNQGLIEVTSSFFPLDQFLNQGLMDVTSSFFPLDQFQTKV